MDISLYILFKNKERKIQIIAILILSTLNKQPRKYNI